MKRFFVVVVFGLGSTITCTQTSDTSSGGGSSSGQAAAPEPIYAGDTTDEAWLEMWDQQRNATDSTTQAATLVTPAENQTLSAQNPPTFEWTSPLAMRGAPSATHRHAMLAPRASWSWVSTAWAHGDPVTGAVHWLRFTLPGGNQVHVFTTELAWTPTVAQWQPFAAAGNADIRLEVTSAYMNQNRVAQGPFHNPQARLFKVQ